MFVDPTPKFEEWEYDPSSLMRKLESASDSFADADTPKKRHKIINKLNETFYELYEEGIVFFRISGEVYTDEGDSTVITDVPLFMQYVEARSDFDDEHEYITLVMTTDDTSNMDHAELAGTPLIFVRIDDIASIVPDINHAEDVYEDETDLAQDIDGLTHLERLKIHLETFEKGLKELAAKVSEVSGHVEAFSDKEQLFTLIDTYTNQWVATYRQYAEAFQVEVSGMGVEVPRITSTRNPEELDELAPPSEQSYISKPEENPISTDMFTSHTGHIKGIARQLDDSEDEQAFSMALVVHKPETTEMVYRDQRGRPLQFLTVTNILYADILNSSVTIPVLEQLRSRDRAIRSAHNLLADEPSLIELIEKLHTELLAEQGDSFIDINVDTLNDLFATARASQNDDILKDTCQVVEGVIGQGRHVKLLIKSAYDENAEELDLGGETASASGKFLYIEPKIGQKISRPVFAIEDIDVGMIYVDITALEKMSI